MDNFRAGRWRAGYSVLPVRRATSAETSRISAKLKARRTDGGIHASSSGGREVAQGQWQALQFTAVAG